MTVQLPPIHQTEPPAGLEVLDAARALRETAGVDVPFAEPDEECCETPE